MSDSSPQSPALSTPRPHRVRFRFSLKTLLLLITLMCVWLGLSYSNARRQQRAVEAIVASHGRVGYDRDPHDEAEDLPAGMLAGPKWLRSLLGRHYFDTVVSVTLNGSRAQGESRRFADVGHWLADLPHVQRLELSYLEVTGDDLAFVATTVDPESLTCIEMEISDQAAARLASASRLGHLGLNNVVISAKGVAEFKKLPKLKSFLLSCRHLEVVPIGQVPPSVETYKLGDEVVTAFLEFPELRSLTLHATLISDDGVKILSRLERLVDLSIASPNITNGAMQDIVKLKNLTWLGIAYTQIGDETLNRLSELPELKTLWLSPRVTNAGLPTVAALQKLESLYLSGKQINDLGLPHLAGMKNLKALDLQSTRITTDGPAVKQLQLALPNCSIRQYHPSPSFR